MKPKNFPARKLQRQLRAKYGNYAERFPEHQAAMEHARNIRTKKRG